MRSFLLTAVGAAALALLAAGAAFAQYPPTGRYGPYLYRTEANQALYNLTPHQPAPPTPPVLVYGFPTGLAAPLPSYYYPRVGVSGGVPGYTPSVYGLGDLGFPLYRDYYGGYRSTFGYPRRWR
jgi:hypothetical protein